MTVTWATTDSFGSFVQYGLTSAYGKEVEGIIFYSSACNQYIHEVLIPDLILDTIYHYRCGDTNGWSNDHTYHTGLPKGSAGFSFIIYGDTRTDTIERIAVRDAMLMHKDSIRFILHTGDIIEYGSNQSQWDIWFQQMKPLISNCPMMPTIGNHEEYGSVQNYLDQFSLPGGSGTERFYSFDYGNLHIASIYDPRPESRIKPGDPQYCWLCNDLGQANNNPSIKWKLVFFHVPPYSAGHGYQNQRTDIPPICDDYGVDAVFNGHVHNYERTYMLYDSTVTDSGPDYNGANDGTVYIITGGGCAPLSNAYYDWWTAFSKKIYHFCLVSVTEDKLTVTVIGDDGSTNIDRWSIVSGPGIAEGSAGITTLKIYPMPSVGSMAIAGLKPERIKTVFIVNDIGQKVKTFNKFDQTLIWDGRDDHQRRLGPGVYFLVVREFSLIRTKKLIILR